MTQKVLFVDDEPNILGAYQRNLRNRFHIETAQGGEHGLAAIASQGPYAVVVSDLRMPGMDGVQFLAKVKEHSPDSVRVMLTGQADMTAAIAAVNEGNIFRFLTKPCPPDILAKTLDASLQQYRLIVAERELLEKTLHGSVKVLTEVLSLVNPFAFSRAFRIRRYVQHMAVQLNLPDVWQFDLAAMLSQIGCITLPPDTLDKIYAGGTLSEDEESIFSSHPSVARNLLVNIPRLELIAQMVERQQKPFGDTTSPADPQHKDVIALGAQMLKVAIDFDQVVAHGVSHKVALAEMRTQRQTYNSILLSALDNFEVGKVEMEAKTIRLLDLNTLMIVDEDIRAKNGLLLVAKGQEITYTVIERLRNFSRKIGVVEPFRVLVPR